MVALAVKRTAATALTPRFILDLVVGWVHARERCRGVIDEVGE